MYIGADECLCFTDAALLAFARVAREHGLRVLTLDGDAAREQKPGVVGPTDDDLLPTGLTWSAAEWRGLEPFCFEVVVAAAHPDHKVQ